MATIKLALPVAVALLLCGLMVIGCSIRRAEATKPGRVCATYCLNAATYMTCPPKGTEKLPPACNCCIAENERRGCTIYLSNGGVEKCQ